MEGEEVCGEGESTVMRRGRGRIGIGIYRHRFGLIWKALVQMRITEFWMGSRRELGGRCKAMD